VNQNSYKNSGGYYQGNQATNGNSGGYSPYQGTQGGYSFPNHGVME